MLTRKVTIHNSLIVLLALALLAARAWLPRGIYGGDGLYPWLEAIGALLGLGIAFFGIKGYLDSGSKRLLLMGLAFFTFAVLELPYSISSPGGLNFVLPDDASVAMWFWEAGRLGGSLLLLLSVLLPETVAPSADVPRERGRIAGFWLGLILIGTAVYSALIAFAITHLPGVWMPRMWSELSGLTSLQTLIEWVAVFFQIGVALAYVQRYQRLQQDVLLFFSLGMVCMGFAGIALTMHEAFYDAFFWVGQVYQLLAYAFFVLGVWRLISQRTEGREPAAVGPKRMHEQVTRAGGGLQ